MDIVGINGLNDIFVTSAAGVFSYLSIKMSNLNVVRVVPSREVKRMKKTVHRLYGVFAGKVMRSVAIVAGSGRAMA